MFMGGGGVASPSTRVCDPERRATAVRFAQGANKCFASARIRATCGSRTLLGGPVNRRSLWTTA